MGDTPEQQATKDALAIVGKWKEGKSYSGLDFLATMPGLEAAAVLKDVPGFLTQGPAPAVGSTIGAVAGSRFGVPGRMVGAGVGAGAGHLFNVGAGISDAPSTGQALKDAVLMGVAGATGQGMGEIGTATARVASRPFTPAPSPGASTLRDAFTATGVDMTVADVSPNMAALERSVAQTPTGGQQIRAAADRRAGQLSRAADEWKDRLAPVGAQDRVAVGEKASASIKRHVERTGALEDALWTEVGRMATDLPVSIRALKQAAADVLLQQQHRLQPNAKLTALAEKIHKAGDEVAWQVADAWRKEFGENIKSGELISGVPTGANKYLHRELLKDMEAAADGSNVTGLRESYKNLRNFSEHRRAIFRDGEVATILETDPERVVSTLNAAGGPTAIKRAREAILGSGELGQAMPNPADVEAWNYVRRHILEGAFTKAVSDEYKGLSNPVIVGSKLEKALKVLGEDGLKELLTDQERAALKNLTAVAKAIRSSEKVGALPGTSTTPQGMGFGDFFKSPGVLLGGLAGGLTGGPAGVPTGAAAGGFASFVLIPHVAAKILTNPRAAQIVASPAFAALASGGKMTAAAAREGTQALTRLAGILFAEGQGGE